MSQRKETKTSTTQGLAGKQTRCRNEKKLKLPVRGRYSDLRDSRNEKKLKLPLSLLLPLS